MVRRRRPLRRVAVTGAVGAAGYHAGKKRSQRESEQQAAAQQPQQPPPAAEQPGQLSDPERLEQLSKLGELHQAGVLTDDEFAYEKQRILRS